MTLVTLLLIVWIAPAVLVLLAAAWFVWTRRGNLQREVDEQPSTELSSSEKS